MTVIDSASGTNVHEVADRIYRISVPVFDGGAGFSFNQYLLLADEPLLFHTGPRRMFALVRQAVAHLMPVERLRHVGFSHVEADECGSLNEWLAVAPQARPLCGTVAKLVSVDDLADRPARALADGDLLDLGGLRLRWFDTPHLPHAWECGLAMEEATGTLLCGDLFTQPGARTPALTRGDILGPSEAFRHALDYYSHSRLARGHIERLALAAPTTLACMHGSAWQGDGAALLRALGERLDADG